LKKLIGLMSLSSLDLFPKYKAEVLQSSTSGGVISVSSFLFIGYLVISQFFSFYTVETTDHLTINTAVDERMDLTFDVTFPRLPCTLVNIDVVDRKDNSIKEHSGDVHKIALDENGRVLSHTKTKTTLGSSAEARRRLQEQQNAGDEPPKEENAGDEPPKEEAQLTEDQKAMDIAMKKFKEDKQREMDKKAGVEEPVKEEEPEKETPKPKRPTPTHLGGRQTAERQKKDGEPEEECGSCYGAELESSQCCNTCEEVKAAYRKRGWKLTDVAGIKQCEGTSLVDKKKALSEHQGCKIEGKINIYKRSGNLQFTPLSLANSGKLDYIKTMEEMLWSFTANEFDTSHRIDFLSFGPHIPNINYPLDGVSHDSVKGEGTIFQYWANVVGSSYTTISGTRTETNQFSVTYHESVAKDRQGNVPGVFIWFEFSPFRVDYVENYPPLFHFLTNLCAIVGGVYTVASLLNRSVTLLERKAREGKLS